MAAPAQAVAAGGAAGPSINASTAAVVRVSLYVQKARQLLTYMRLVGRGDGERRKAAERRGARAVECVCGLPLGVEHPVTGRRRRSRARRSMRRRCSRMTCCRERPVFEL